MLMVYVVIGLYILCWCWCLEIRTGSIHWTQLNRLLPEDRERVQSHKCCMLSKTREDGKYPKPIEYSFAGRGLSESSWLGQEGNAAPKSEVIFLTAVKYCLRFPSDVRRCFRML
jgi:hypothetical protein